MDSHGEDVHVLAPSEGDLGGIGESEGGVDAECHADAVENQLVHRQHGVVVLGYEMNMLDVC